MASGNTLRFVAYRNRSGEYWCSADNGLGQAENSSAHLYVYCKYDVSAQFQTKREREREREKERDGCGPTRNNCFQWGPLYITMAENHSRLR